MAGSGDIVLNALSTLTVPLSTLVYKLVPTNLMLGQPCNGLASHPWGGGGGGSRDTPSRSCYRNRDKLWPVGPLAHMQNLAFQPLYLQHYM